MRPPLERGHSTEIPVVQTGKPVRAPRAGGPSRWLGKSGQVRVGTGWGEMGLGEKARVGWGGCDWGAAVPPGCGCPDAEHGPERP